ncbi:lengsin-like [Amphiura filiformis]|uniref:lengsin-like n=1 Tax=Amphiura filiformis TaxID=82378 RepID=UPI003B21BF57
MDLKQVLESIMTRSKSTDMNLKQVLESIKENNIEQIRLEISDQYGVARCKTIPARHFEEKYNYGHNFVQLGFMAYDPMGHRIKGTGFAEEINFGDTVCYPDLNTYTILPWCENTARVLVDCKTDGKPVKSFPRGIAKIQCDRLNELGYSLLAAHEHEFPIFKHGTRIPAFDSYQWNATSRCTFNPAYTKQILRQLPLVGIDIQAMENEGSPGTMEVTYKPVFDICAADHAHTYKAAMKEIAQQHNYVASFMTNPAPASSIKSAQLNHSLWNRDGKTALFYDASSPTGLSTVAQHWMAGILAHAPAITLLLCPTINCIKCLQPNSFMPINTTWGFDNRSCLLRVKRQGPHRTYIENRLCGSAASPYLSLAGMLIAGIDGIQRQLPLPKPVTGSAYEDKNLPSGTSRLPNTMKDAIQAFLGDKVVIEALGSDFVKAFIAAKMHEMQCEENAKAKGDEHWEENYYAFL